MRPTTFTSPTRPATRILAAAVLALGAATTSQAQTTQTVTTTQTTVAAPAPVTFPVEVGRATTQASPDTSVSCVVVATQPMDSKEVSQKLRMVIQTMRGGGTGTRYMTINTGKYKTLTQLRSIIADVFRRFVAGGAAPGTDLGKIGDARYGGEIHFVAVGPDQLRFDYVPATEGGQPFELTRAEAQSFLAILNGTPIQG